MPLPALLQKVVAWLRAGYPQGVPEVDYIPLFALLARRLSLEEVEQVTAELVREGRLDEVVTPDMVRSAITAVTEEPALESDVKRIGEHLASVGWVVTEPAKGKSEVRPS